MTKKDIRVERTRALADRLQQMPEKTLIYATGVIEGVSISASIQHNSKRQEEEAS